LQKILKKLLTSGQKLEGFKGRKIFAREPLAKLRSNFASVRQSASGFCSKKVLTSSNRHHHIELAASLGASPLASAGRFASKLKGFLKSIESFCWLIWRFANFSSLLVLKKTKADFFLSPLAKGKARFYQIVGVSVAFFNNN